MWLPKPMVSRAEAAGRAEDTFFSSGTQGASITIGSLVFPVIGKTFLALMLSTLCMPMATSKSTGTSVVIVRRLVVSEIIALVRCSLYHTLYCTKMDS